MARFSDLSRVRAIRFLREFTLIRAPQLAGEYIDSRGPTSKPISVFEGDALLHTCLYDRCNGGAMQLLIGAATKVMTLLRGVLASLECRLLFTCAGPDGD